jgi:hypothetical protein
MASIPENGELIFSRTLRVLVETGSDRPVGSRIPAVKKLLSPTWDESSNLALIVVGVSADADATVTRLETQKKVMALGLLQQAVVSPAQMVPGNTEREGTCPYLCTVR